MPPLRSLTAPAAFYSSYYQAPACLTASSSCSTLAPGAPLTTSLLYSRGAQLIPPEVHAPNTVFSQCQDTDISSSHNAALWVTEESLQSITVRTALNQANNYLSAGATVRATRTFMHECSPCIRCIAPSHSCSGNLQWQA